MSAVRLLAGVMAWCRGETGSNEPGYLELSPKASAAETCDWLAALYHLRDTAKRLRGQLTAEGAPLDERFLLAKMQEEVQRAIDGVHRSLATPLDGVRRPAGRRPVMAHGCAAVASPAVGPALREAAGEALSLLNDRAFLGPVVAGIASAGPQNLSSTPKGGAFRA